MSDAQELRPFDLLQIVAAIALVAITIFVGRTLTSSGMEETYQVVLYVLVTIVYLAILPSFILTIAGQVKSQSLRLGVASVSAVTLVALTALVFGLLQDAAGIRCEGFFGVTRLCADRAAFWVTYFLVHPLFFIPATLIMSGFLIAGLLDEYRSSRGGKKKTSRRRQ